MYECQFEVRSLPEDFYLLGFWKRNLDQESRRDVTPTFRNCPEQWHADVPLDSTNAIGLLEMGIRARLAPGTFITAAVRINSSYAHF